MGKVIRLTESQLTHIIKKIIKEQVKTLPYPIPKGLIPCGKIGVKYIGLCHEQKKLPVEKCSKFGLKYDGWCFVATKEPALDIKVDLYKTL